MTDVQEQLAKSLEEDLLRRFGPLVGQEDLRAALGFATMEAFRQALVRRKVEVPVFSLPNRRGKFALAKDVAEWLSKMRALSVPEKRGSAL